MARKKNGTKFDLSLEHALDQQAKHIQLLAARINRPTVGGGVANELVQGAVHEIARDPWVVEHGQFLSTILRLPLHWSNSLSEYIQQVKPYERTGFSYRGTIRNEGDISCRIVVGTKDIPKRDPQSGQALSDMWQTIASYRVLEPGEEIRLNAERAVNALYKYSWWAQRPGIWESSNGSKKSMPLIEVAYDIEYEDFQTGELVEIRGGSGAKPVGKAAEHAGDLRPEV